MRKVLYFDDFVMYLRLTAVLFLRHYIPFYLRCLSPDPKARVDIKVEEKMGFMIFTSIAKKLFPVKLRKFRGKVTHVYFDLNFVFCTKCVDTSPIFFKQFLFGWYLASIAGDKEKEKIFLV